MTSMMNTLKSAALKRAAYHRTVRAIEAMPTETAIDLGIYREDARLMARKAIYG